MQSKLPLIVVACIFALNLNQIQCDDQARYDLYRVYRFHLETDEHVKVFKEIEERSDSYGFMGHAREINQKLTVLVASQKIAEITEITKRKNVKFEILVNID